MELSNLLKQSLTKRKVGEVFPETNKFRRLLTSVPVPVPVPKVWINDPDQFSKRLISVIRYCSSSQEKCTNHILCLGDMSRQLKTLLDGNSLNFEALNKNKPLICAAQIRNFTAISILLQYDLIDLNQADDKGRNFLMVLCSKNTFLPGNMLLERVVKNASFKVNMKDNEDMTILLYAAEKFNTFIVELIMQRPDADLNVQDRQGNTAFDFLLKTFELDSVAATLHKLYVDVRCESMKCKYVQAIICDIAEYSDLTVFKYFFDNRKAFPFEPEFSPSCNTNTAMAFLSVVFADMDLEDLHSIASECLESPKVSINWQCDKGQTLLHKLCMNKYTSDPSTSKVSKKSVQNVIKILFDSEIDVNKQDEERQTALMVALNQELPPDVIALLANHPYYDFSLRNNFQQTCVMIYESLNEEYKSIKLTSLFNYYHAKESTKQNKKHVPLLETVAQLRAGIESTDFAQAGNGCQEDLLQHVSFLEAGITGTNQRKLVNQSGMLQKHRQKLIANRVFICQELIPSGPQGVVNHLVQDQIIDLNTFESFNETTSRLKQTEMLLSILPSRGPKAYPSFLRALKETEQKHIAEELEKFDPNQTN